MCCAKARPHFNHLVVVSFDNIVDSFVLNVEAALNVSWTVTNVGTRGDGLESAAFGWALHVKYLLGLMKKLVFLESTCWRQHVSQAHIQVSHGPSAYSFATGAFVLALFISGLVNGPRQSVEPVFFVFSQVEA